MQNESIELSQISLQKPGELLQFGKVLQEYIVKNNLFTKIQGRQYAHVDGWKFAGNTLGLSAIPSDPIAKHTGETLIIAMVKITLNKTVSGRPQTYQIEKPGFVGFSEDEFKQWVEGEQIKPHRVIRKPFFSYSASCEVVNMATGTIVSRGNSICSNMELSKTSWDEYSVQSMAQTRCIGKGYRNLIGYVMNSAGFEATPAEEMEEDHLREKVKPAPGYVEKPAPSEEQFEALLKRKGEAGLLETATKHFTLTPEQIIELTNKKKS